MNESATFVQRRGIGRLHVLAHVHAQRELYVLGELLLGASLQVVLEAQQLEVEHVRQLLQSNASRGVSQMVANRAVVLIVASQLFLGDKVIEAAAKRVLSFNVSASKRHSLEQRLLFFGPASRVESSRRTARTLEMMISSS